MTRGVKVRPLRVRDCEAALAYLEREPRLNLLLLDLVLRLRSPARRGERRPEVLAAFRDGELAGLAALQPSVVFDASAAPDALQALLPYLAGVGSGLVRSTDEVVAPLWAWLQRHGRRALLDRTEIGFALQPGDAMLVQAAPGVRVRSAVSRDLTSLVEAARASLREESRPDSFRGDPTGFRRWVKGRLQRATVAECDGRIVFVGYADVQCQRGWLLQGVYTWPDWRRHGLAAAGVSEICRRAFEAGADHVQLAVVDGNTAAMQLYERLGFRTFARLRTLLFA